MKTVDSETSTIPVEVLFKGLHSSKTFEFVSPFSLSECLERVHGLSVETFMFGGALNRTVKILKVTANKYTLDIEELRRPKNVEVVAKVIADLTWEENTGETLVRGNLYLGNTNGFALIAAFFSILSTIYAWNTAGIEVASQSLFMGLLITSYLYWSSQTDRNRLIRLLERTLTR